MFPFRDHNPSEKTPFVTIGLIVINVVVFISYWPLFEDPRALSAYFNSWGLVPLEATQTPTGFVTSMFLHGGLLHLGGNMLFLWIFGDNLEEDMGHVGFLLFYLAAGLGAGLAQVMADPGSSVPMVGASGAIAGVMGGYLLLYPRARIDVLFIFIIIFKIVPIPAWVMLGFWFGLQVFNGVAGLSGGVAHWAHAGGFVVGFLLTLPIWQRLGGQSYWRKTDGHPPHPEATYSFRTSPIPRIPRKK